MRPSMYFDSGEKVHLPNGEGEATVVRHISQYIILCVSPCGDNIYINTQYMPIQRIAETRWSTKKLDADIQQYYTMSYNESLECKED
uniref:Uncharacterized protein n=1 Tax=Megaviridae environmental sample TaxID=1737588 RepID=A0A5J6VJB1_9VIRU|nr:MAG: hypothetical protein [Megaviridae environmental sample]